MSDPAAAQLTIDAARDLKSLELLYDYTKFHIGVYLTLTGVYITLATSNVTGGRLPRLRPWPAAIAVLAFLVAGFAGGVVASSITQCKCGSADQFLGQITGPLWWGWFSGRCWTQIEHTSFWIGILAAIWSFVPAEAPRRIGFRGRGRADRTRA